MMRGWKTWLGGLLSIIYGAVGWLVDLHGPDTAWQYVINGIIVLGIGHKIEKAAAPAPQPLPEPEPEKKEPLDGLVKRNQR